MTLYTMQIKIVQYAISKKIYISNGNLGKLYDTKTIEQYTNGELYNANENLNNEMDKRILQRLTCH